MHFKSTIWIGLIVCLLTSACKFTFFDSKDETISNGGAKINYDLDLEPKDFALVSKMELSVNGGILEDMPQVSISSNDHFVLHGEIYADSSLKSLHFSKYFQTHIDLENKTQKIDIFSSVPLACQLYQHNSTVEVQGLCLKSLKVEIPETLKVIVKRRLAVPVVYEIESHQITTKTFYGDTPNELIQILTENPMGMRQVEAVEGFLHNKPGRILYVEDVKRILDCSAIFKRDIIRLLSGKVIDVQNVSKLKQDVIWQEDLDLLSK